MKHIAKFVVIFILLLTLKATDSGWDTVPIANAAFDCADPGIECHSGTISSNETWTASQVHFVDDVLTIAQNATLTIEDDVIIKMITIGNDNNEIIVAGTLNINDSGGQPVYITSSRDDTTPDGDTNGDGSDSTPYDGIWRSITFQSGSSGTFNNVEIRFAGDDTRGAIHVEDSNHTLQLNNLTVKNSDWAAISALADHNITVTGFTTTKTPVGGLEIRSDALTTSTTWNETDLTYFLTNPFTIANTGNLTIEDDVIVKMVTIGNDNNEFIVAGTLNINDSGGQPVYITSSRDDTTPDGDTNGDGSDSTPYDGIWRSITFQSGSSGTFNNVEIRFAGDDTRGAIHVEDSNHTLQLNNLTVKNSDWAAISALADHNITVTGFTTTKTPVGGLEIRSDALTTSTTWNETDLTYFLTNPFTIANTGNLTIEDDVIVKMVTIGNDNNEIIVAGTLNINDSGGQPVYITSSRDDTTPDGDTNGDGSGTTPYDGIWRSITFQSGSSGTFNNVEIRFAGDDTRGAIHVEDSNHTLQLNNLTVKNSDWAAISALANHNITVNGFTANSTPIGGLEIRNTALTGNTTWDQTGIVHIISDDFTVASGGKLTIDPGIVVKFASGKSLLVDGELDVNGTANNNVYFTSLRDDTLPAGNGDTNGDGGNTTPAPGNWKSIYFRNGSDGSIDHAQIRYGGSGSNTGAVQVASVSPSISNSTLRNNKIALYSTGSGATPEVNNSDFFTIASLLLWQAALAKF